jgi:hypothetical protein
MDNISILTVQGTSYAIKDSEARTAIEEIKTNISGGVHYLGVTTDALTDGSTKNPITISNTSVTAKNGDLVIYNKLEFIYSESDKSWHEFGSTGSLKALAFKDSASGSITPSGSVTSKFTGDKISMEIDFTPEGSVAISSSTTGTKNYTPSGTISTPTVSADVTSKSIKVVNSVGALPTCKLPVMDMSVASETLTLAWTAGSFSAGSLPTTANATVVESVSNLKSTQPTFTGNGTVLSASFSGTANNYVGEITPTGSVSSTFKGSTANVTVS